MKTLPLLTLIVLCGFTGAAKRQNTDCADQAAQDWFQDNLLDTNTCDSTETDLAVLCQSGCIQALCSYYVSNGYSSICSEDLETACQSVGSPIDCTEGSCLGFLCQSNGLCIPSSYTCDGFSDCSDGSDESSCASSILGIIIGATIGGTFLLTVFSIVCVIVIYCCAIGGAAASGSRHHRPPPQTRIAAPPPAQTTTAVITTTARQPVPVHTNPAYGELQQEPPPPYDPKLYPPPPGLHVPNQVYPPYPEQQVYPPSNPPYPEQQAYPAPAPSAPYPQQPVYPPPAYP